MQDQDKEGKLRVMAIAAHPDDVELFCAGTLARYADRGDAVTIAIACQGDSASLDLSPDELVRMRSQEAGASAQVLGAHLIQMGLPDWGVDINQETRKRFADAIRQANPDVIFTHFHTDYGSDHNNTFVLVRDAALVATVPSIATRHPAIAGTPAIFMWEPLGGYGFQPEVFVDITATFATKLRMLECHRSQREWLSRHGGMDFSEYVATIARFRGFQAGVRLAEGFVPLKNWANMRARAILP
ncbi:MAG: PIG-L family deacetylase [Acidobacteriota bacterium]